MIELDKVSDFSPQIFEQRFYDEKNFGDVQINLSGQIDRIDLSGDGKYFLIIDYKTGKAKLDLKKIFGGLSLQLAIYLGEAKNLSDVKGREAGAMLYCMLRISDESGDDDSDAATKAEKDLKMRGLIRVDEEIKKAVDSSGNFVYFDEKKKTNLMSRDDLQTIVAYAEKFLDATAEKILGGCIDVKPAKFSNDDACEYCVYSALCNFNRATDETLTATDFKNAEIISAMNDFLSE